MDAHREQGQGGESRALHKAATGIAGLDAVLSGGLPRGRTTLVRGGPGCGKTVLALEFLYRGALQGEAGIFVAFEERAAFLRQNALTLGWDLEALEGQERLLLLEARLEPGTVVSGEFDLEALLAILAGWAREAGARRIVLDAVDMLLRLAGDEDRIRRLLYVLHEWLLDHELTGIFTLKTADGGRVHSGCELLDFMVDCVLHLDQRVDSQNAVRRLRVVKYRGSGFGRNEYPFLITAEGFSVVGLSQVDPGDREPPQDRLSSGHPLLDDLLGGGYLRGSCTMLAGYAGTGKTTLACLFAQAACGRGEKVLFVCLEQSARAMLSHMLSPGVDLRPALESGCLRLEDPVPEMAGAEEHLLAILKALENLRPDHLVVDAISACERMGSEGVARELLLRLVFACRKSGITCILTNQTQYQQDQCEISAMGISSVVDAVVLLRQVETGGALKRALLVLKARGMRHSDQCREFRITDRGIEMGGVFAIEGRGRDGDARF